MKLHEEELIRRFQQEHVTFVCERHRVKMQPKQCEQMQEHQPKRCLGCESAGEARLEAALKRPRENRFGWSGGH